MADSPRRTVPAWKTAGWGYLRLHGPDEEVFVFFNNDPNACAVHDARVFAAACRRHGLEPTRVPGPREVAVVR